MSSKNFLDAIYKGLSRDQVIQKKTTEPQRRSFVSGSGRGGKVSVTAEECKQLCAMCNNLTYFPGAENRIRQYRITDETVDRYGDIVRARGVSLANYRKNPVVQFAHDYSQPPVGNAIKVWFDQDANCVYAWALFFDATLDPTGRADLIHRLVSSNAMNACSIGFIPATYNDPASDGERKKLGLGKYGVEYLTSDMTEFSPVPVPANQNALQESFERDYVKGLRETLRSGLFSKKDADVMRQFPVLGSNVIDAFIKELDAGKQGTVPEIPSSKDSGEPGDTPDTDLDEGVEHELAEYLADNPTCDDTMLEQWCKDRGVDEEAAETIIIGWACKWVRIMLGGMSVTKGLKAEDVDPEELKLGIAQEAEEHTLNKASIDNAIAAKLAMDNLAAGDHYPETKAASMSPIVNIHLETKTIIDSITALSSQIDTVSGLVKVMTETSSKAVQESTAQIRRDMDVVLSTARQAAELLDEKASVNKLYDALEIPRPQK